MENIKLNQSEILTFNELISNLGLIDIYISRLNYSKVEIKPTTNKFEVKINIKPDEIEIEEKILKANINFNIKLNYDEAPFFTFEVDYKVIFSMKDIGTVEYDISVEKIKKFFLQKHIPRIVWPYLRQEFNNSTGKSGMKPFNLPIIM